MMVVYSVCACAPFLVSASQATYAPIRELNKYEPNNRNETRNGELAVHAEKVASMPATCVMDEAIRWLRP